MEECDIVDKEQAEKFRKKRKEWLELLMGKDTFSIWNQIHWLLLNHGVFLAVNELRRIAQGNSKDEVGFNGMVIGLFDSGFATVQSLAIRRLIEKPNNKEEKGVVSLRMILKDIKCNLDLITRENYVCHDGTPYDWNIGGLDVEQRIESSRRHSMFDKLARKNESERSRDDFIHIKTIVRLEQKIAECDGIRQYVNKFVAHAASYEKRKAFKGKNTNYNSLLTIGNFEKCYKALHNVSNIILNYILFENNVGPMAEPQFDLFENLDKKWSTSENLDRARAKWYEFKEKTEKWDQNAIELLGSLNRKR